MKRIPFVLLALLLSGVACSDDSEGPKKEGESDPVIPSRRWSITIYCRNFPYTCCCSSLKSCMSDHFLHFLNR